ncbi:MAG: hypothetical protein GY832_15335 [Chloroflexi bacterium]|nr:hypothetical protein [Chloroflexota bacterium]
MPATTATTATNPKYEFTASELKELETYSTATWVPVELVDVLNERLNSFHSSGLPKRDADLLTALRDRDIASIRANLANINVEAQS